MVDPVPIFYKNDCLVPAVYNSCGRVISINARERKEIIERYKVDQVKYRKGIEGIDTLTVFNTALLYNDLKEAADVKEHKGFFKRILDSFLGSEEPREKTDIDQFFSDIESIPFPFIPLIDKIEAEDLWEYTEYYLQLRESFISNKEKIVGNLRDIITERFFKNEFKDRFYEKLTKLAHSIPLILRLFEFMYDTFSLKDINPVNKDLVQERSIKLIILYHGKKDQNRFIVLAN